MTWEERVSARVWSILVTSLGPCRASGSLWAGAVGGLPLRGLQGRAWQPGLIPLPSREVPGQPQPWASATSLGTGMWAQLSSAHGKVGQGCGELETSPAAASLGQGLMAPGGTDMGSWAMGRVRGARAWG